MSKICMDADGKTRGKACALDKTCTTPLICKEDTGLCDLSGSGNWKDACQTDADCNTKYAGLKCSAQSICDCTDSSGILSLCSDTNVCVDGSPGPAPTPSSWPPAFPGATTAQISQFDGDCSSATAWYTPATCQPGNLAARNAGQASVACITTANWKSGVTPSSYDKYCYLPPATK